MVTLTGEEVKKVRDWARRQNTRPTLNAAMKHALRVLGKNVTKSAMHRFLGPNFSHLDDLDASNPVLKKKRARRCRYPLLEELLNKWQLELEEQGLGTSGELIQARAVKMWRTVPEVRGGKEEDPVPEFGASWLEGYKSRYGIKRRTFHGEAASVSVTTAAVDEMSQLKEEVAGVPVGNRYNMDETALYWRLAPSVSLATRNLPGVKKDKSRVTLAMTTNDTGDDGFPVWVIGKAKVPRPLAGFPFQAHGLVWKSNRTAWMTGEIMGQWLKAFYAHIAATKPGQKVILLLDNFSGHRAGVDMVPPPANIAVRFLPPNTTSIWQPMDQGIIRAFKTFYRRSFMRWYGERVGPANFIKDVTLRHAME
jgi:DDE superfamily endonuclease/Tc5 transposase DNA-binding domain